MYQLTVNGKPVGKKYSRKEPVMKKIVRLWPTMHGLWWTRV